MLHASSFEINSETEAGSGRLTLSGELDLATVPRVEAAVDALLADGSRDLVIDLSRLSFIDSSGLRLFIVLDSRAVSEDWTLGLIRPQEQVLAVFQVSDAEQHLPFVERPGAAT